MPPAAVRSEFVEAAVPGTVTTCATPLPANIKTMGDVKYWVVQLFGAAKDCETNAAAVREIVSGAD